MSVYDHAPEKMWGFEYYLTLHPDYGIKMTQTPPKHVGGSSRIMKMYVKVPKSLFATPSLSATVTVSEEQAATMKIDTQAAAEALQLVIGARVEVVVESPEA